MLAFRHSKMQDIDAMMDVVEAGKELLYSLGIDQWQKGYPNRELLISDMEEGIGYVITDDDKVVGICAVTFAAEEAYRKIHGAWLTPETCPYAVIHRGAIARGSQGKGLTGFLFSSAADVAREHGAVSLRADTHPENAGMQRALEKAGFTRCGEIALIGGPEDGDIRIAYEMKI